MIKLKAILSLCPLAEVIVRGDTVEWIKEPAIKPTDAEIAAEEIRLAQVEAATAYQGARRIRYEAEADPLFFMEQRGEVPVGTYAAKIAEIKAAIPKTM